MKGFIIILMFLLLLAVFAAGALGNTDLTPDTPPAAPAPGGNAINGILPQSPVGGQVGACGSAYTVVSGDTLSSIARACGVTLQDLLAANPSISDPNLIHVGQQLSIYYPPAPAVTAPTVTAPTAAVPAPVVPTAAIPAALPSSTPALLVTATTPVSPIFPTAAPLDTAAPDPAGETITVSPGPAGQLSLLVTGLPVTVPVEIAMVKEGSDPVVLDRRITDAKGSLSYIFGIPPKARAGETWVVTVATIKQPAVKLTSDPFIIKK